MSDVALMEQVKVGREQLAPCLEHNIEDMDYFCRFKWDSAKLSWQHQLKDNDNKEWLEFGISDEVDNWGMFADENGRRVDVKDNVITTSYDGILQVLESLEVGTGQAGSGYWTQRTVNPIVHPNGPNILIRSEQGREFRRIVKGKEVEFRVRCYSISWAGRYGVLTWWIAYRRCDPELLQVSDTLILMAIEARTNNPHPSASWTASS